MAPRKRRLPLYARILLGMLAGGAIGLWMGEGAAPLGDLGKLVIQLIRILATPLLFLAILETFLKTEIKARSGLWMVVISAINATIAVLIGMGLSNWLRPGELLRDFALSHRIDAGAAVAAAASAKIDFARTLAGYVPASVLHPFFDNAIIPLVLLAVLLGLALRRVRVEQTEAGESGWQQVEALVSTALRATEVLLAWIIKLVPIAVFGVVARTVGEHGLAPLKGLAVYLGVGLLGLLVHILFVYQGWIFFFSKMGLRRFWAGAREPVVYAMGASSSLATLPVTLRNLDEMGVSKESARMAACVGTNLNNDGILLYEAMAVLFVAQVYGVHLTPLQQVMAAGSCVVATVGIPGVPEAGLISLSIVLTTAGLPVEILPLLLTVDWVLGRARAMTNVISDMLVSVMLDRFAPPKKRMA